MRKPQSTENLGEDGALRLCAGRIQQSINQVFAQIELLRHATLQLWQDSAGQPLSRDMAGLRPLIDSTLREAGGALQGGGVILAPGALQDEDMYAQWRCLNRAGRITQLALSFNRKSESYYDYRNMPWFTRPQQTGRSSITGPYIDLYGQDMYILTFTSPIQPHGRFIGIAGIDIISSRFEAVLIAHLLRLPTEALIVSEEGRVIAANSANYIAGELFGQAGGRSAAASQRLDVGAENARWSLIGYARCRDTQAASV